jgi:prepilin-type N-terminal cleavage/methylation domain-containing protein
MRQPEKSDFGPKGFTLIEILIAVAISAIVLSALVMAFRNQQIVYSQQTDLTRSQASSRAALYMMARDIRMAGYTGIPLGWEKISAVNDIFPVVSVKDGATLIPGPSFMNGLANNLRGVSGNDSAGSPDAIAIIGNFSRQTTTLANPVFMGATSMVVNNVSLFAGTGFNKPAWVIVGQPGATINVEIFKIASVNTGTNTIAVEGAFTTDYGVLVGSTTGAFAESVVVSPVFLRAYYVQPNLQAGQNTRIPTLFVRNYGNPDDPDSNFTDMELAQGVIDLQFSYDVTAGTVSDPRLDSGKDIICDPCTIRGVNISLQTWSDKFRDNKPLVREFATSVQVRNIGINQTLFNCPIAGCAY